VYDYRLILPASFLVAVLTAFLCTLGQRIGSVRTENKTHATLDACLDKELVGGMAECDDPNFMVRKTCQGLKAVTWVGGSQSDLRTVSNNVFFGCSEPPELNFIKRHLTQDGLPLGGIIHGNGVMMIITDETRQLSREAEGPIESFYLEAISRPR